MHPGGPFFQNKNKGVWNIPKGLPEKGEDLQKAAIREFEEETGIKAKGELLSLGTAKQKNGKIVHAWAMEGDLPEGFTFQSNLFELEWPPHSGKKQQFPEMDKATFFPTEAAKEKIIPAQIPLIERLEELVRQKGRF